MASFATYVGALIDDLTDFQVETLVLDATRRDMPPANPNVLMDEVEGLARSEVDAAAPGLQGIVANDGRVSRADELRIYAQRAGQLVEDSRRGLSVTDEPVITTFDPDAMERTRDALRLLVQVHEGRTARLTNSEGEARSVDHRLVRELTRYRETTQTVWCRTTMRFDGDATTLLRFDNAEAAPINTAHRAMTLAAIDQWQLLIVTFGTLVAALTELRPQSSLWSRLRWRSIVQSLCPPPGVRFLGPFQLLQRIVQLYSLGRVVFESPLRGDDAAVRTMLLASGDVETTIRRGVNPAVFVAHTDLVTRWLVELRDGVLWWSKMFRPMMRILGLALLLTAVGLGTIDEWLSPWALLPLVLTVVSQLFVVGGRRLLRWKLKQVTGHLRGKVRVLQPKAT